MKLQEFKFSLDIHNHLIKMGLNTFEDLKNEYRRQMNSIPDDHPLQVGCSDCSAAYFQALKQIEKQESENA